MSAPRTPSAPRQPYGATPFPGPFPPGERDDARTRAVAGHVIAATGPAGHGLPAGTAGTLRTVLLYGPAYPTASASHLAGNM